MNDRKFSLKAEHVLRCAQAAAGELGHGYVGCEHLLLAMLREDCLLYTSPSPRDA